jgi:hypothetical protein
VSQMVGRVTPPKDMVEAARGSLSASGFDKLMRRLNGRSPTSAELVAAVEEDNGDRHELNAAEQPAQ